MAKTRPPKASEPLDRRAVSLVAKKHYIKDAFVAFAERGTLRKTSEPQRALSLRIWQKVQTVSRERHRLH
jgi:hypothetical protein